MNSKYKNSGVNIETGNELVKVIKKINSVKIKGVMKENIGWFAGGFDISKYNFKKPVIFAANDGVGTKLLLAIHNKNITTIGEDLVAMSVNDLVCHGAKPLFFLDYIGTNKIEADQFKIILKNIIDCLFTFNCALLGGETAELKLMYNSGEYDLCGMAVGACEKNKIIDPKNIKNDDIIIGIASNGFHSNGYSLLNKIIKDNKLDLNTKYFNKEKLIDILLKPTHIYVNCILELHKKFKINGAAHITGGGIKENINRILNVNQKAKIHLTENIIQKEFLFFQKEAKMQFSEMLEIFNMGIGYAIIINPKNKNKAFKTIEKYGFKYYQLGKITSGNGVDITWDPKLQS